VVDGWIANSAVSVNGGTLGGTGHLSSVAVNSGGHLVPGDLNTGALILAGDVSFQDGELEIVGKGSSITSVAITGNLSLNGNSTLEVTGSLAAGTYTIASYGGTLSGQFTALNIPAGDTISYGTRSDSSITLSVVPEPSTFMLLGVGAIGLIAYGWRRHGSARAKCGSRTERI